MPGSGHLADGGSARKRRPAGNTGRMARQSGDVMPGQAFSIKIQNSSKEDNKNAIVYQEPPDLPSDVHTLAWLSKTCHAGTWVDFDWTVDLNFVWGQEPNLKTGVNYKAGQVISADLDGQNKVNLLYQGGGYKFGAPVGGPDNGKGSLFISQGPEVPGDGDPDQGSVGIGMSGAGTFVVPTGPDGGGGTQFSITPEYWVSFGEHIAGTVVTQDILHYPYKLSFPTGRFNAVCIFDSGWSVSYR
jgi:hypothetical protein